MATAHSPNTITLAQTALLLIDVQRAFNYPPYSECTRSNPALVENITRLLSAFRNASRVGAKAETAPASDSQSAATPPSGPLVIHVQHHSLNLASPFHPTHPGSAIEPYATRLPSEPLFTKSVNSAFIGTDLEAHLRAHDVRRLVICGLTTDHCVSTTTRMAANLDVVGEGGELLLIGDATAAHEKGGFPAEVVQAVNEASLDGEFCRVVTVEVLLRELGL